MVECQYRRRGVQWLWYALNARVAAIMGAAQLCLWYVEWVGVGEGVRG